MEEFAKRLKVRLDEAMPHGTAKKVAQALSLHPNQITRWGAIRQDTGKVQIPDIYQIQKAAEYLGVSPAWLAFGEGSKDPIPADPEELNLVALFRQLGDGERLILKGVMEKFIQAERINTTSRVQTPALPRVEIDHDAGVTAITPPAKDPRELAREHGPAYIKPPKKPKRMDRRHEYRIIPYSTVKSAGAVNIPCFSAVAAGFGADLERAEDLVYVRELPDWRGVHSLIVRGDSMEDTLHPRDLVMIETFNNGDGITLEGLAPEDAKTPYQQVQKRIPDDEIFVLSIDDEPPTIKRVIYDTHKPQDWHLVITADNPDYKLRVLTRGTPIRFYGRLIAIGQKDGEKQYTTVKPGQEYPKHIEEKLKRKR